MQLIQYTPVCIYTHTRTRAHTHTYIHKIHFNLGFHFYRRRLLRCPDQSAVESWPTHNLTSSWIVLLLRQTYIICFSTRKVRTDHGWGSSTQTCNHIRHFSGNLQRISRTHTNGRTHVHGLCNFCNPICSVLLFFVLLHSMQAYALSKINKGYGALQNYRFHSLLRQLLCRLCLSLKLVKNNDIWLNYWQKCVGRVLKHLKMIPLMGSPHLSKWVRTRRRKGLTVTGYPSRDPTAVTPASSEGNTCYTVLLVWVAKSEWIWYKRHYHHWLDKSSSQRRTHTHTHNCLCQRSILWLSINTTCEAYLGALGLFQCIIELWR